MPQIHEDLSAQINDVKTIFTTTNDITDGLIAFYNGLAVNNNDVTILTSNSFQLTFAPQLTRPTGQDRLSIQVNPVVYDITGQVDGVRTVFQKDPADLDQGDFIAIKNGVVLTNDTIQIDQDSFYLEVPPQIGDALEYFRIVFVENLKIIIEDIPIVGRVFDDFVSGLVQDDEVIGLVVSSQNASGEVVADYITGKVINSKIKGEVNCYGKM
jgi:hypothetical protein